GAYRADLRPGLVRRPGARPLVAWENQLDVLAAHVEERRRGHLPSPWLKLPHLRLRHCDEIARLFHEVADARAGYELDEAAYAVGRSEDGDFCPVFHAGNVKPGRYIWPMNATHKIFATLALLAPLAAWAQTRGDMQCKPSGKDLVFDCVFR